jgi:hypothetical protein
MRRAVTQLYRKLTEERKEVSARMKKYWAARRREKK